jgi:hypothetical protein
VLHGFGADLKIAARRLAAAPVFTAFAILSLAVGIGVTTAVYSVVDRIFWKDAGVHDPDTLALIVSPEGGDDGRWAVSAPDLDDFRRRQTSFTRVTGVYVVFPAVASGAATETQRAEAVDGDYFALLDVPAHIGRVLQHADHSEGAAVVVLGYELWRTRFNADPSVLGQTVRLSGQPFEIVGVAPESFRGALPGLFGSSMWIPLSRVEPFDPGNPQRPLPERERRRFTVVGRLKPGMSAQQASAEASAFAAALDQEYPRTITQPGRPIGRGWSVSTLTALKKPGDDLRGFGLLVFGLITMVLVVALHQPGEPDSRARRRPAAGVRRPTCARCTALASNQGAMCREPSARTWRRGVVVAGARRIDPRVERRSSDVAGMVRLGAARVEYHGARACRGSAAPVVARVRPGACAPADAQVRGS